MKKLLTLVVVLGFLSNCATAIPEDVNWQERALKAEAEVETLKLQMIRVRYNALTIENTQLQKRPAKKALEDYNKQSAEEEPNG